MFSVIFVFYLSLDVTEFISISNKMFYQAEFLCWFASAQL